MRGGEREFRAINNDTFFEKKEKRKEKYEIVFLNETRG